MDYFCRRQKSTFNLENSKGIYQGNVFVGHITGFTYSGIIIWAMYISMVHTKLWKELEKVRLLQS